MPEGKIFKETIIIPESLPGVLFKEVYVVVFFLTQVISIFSLFLGMVMYANEFETMEK